LLNSILIQEYQDIVLLLIIIKQHVDTGIPGYCVIAQIKEFIEDNLTGHKVSQKLAEQYGI